MLNFTIVVKPFRAEAVLDVISKFGVSACTVREAKGFGRQKGYLNQYRGGEFSEVYIPKVEITIAIEKERYEELVTVVTRTARTGRIGDGKLFVLKVAYPVIEF